MTDAISNNDIKDDLLNVKLPEKLAKNKRTATRFVRKDITATLVEQDLFGAADPVVVDLVDITSKGVLVRTNKNLTIGNKVVITLYFPTGKTFIIKSSIARNSSASKVEYGIKFDRFNDELGDYLLETQSLLIFK